MSTNTEPFVPTPSLLELSIQFSENFRILNVGHYFSGDGMFHIKYNDKIPESKAGIRISRRTGVIEIDRDVVIDPCFTSDCVFFLILWVVEFDLIRSPMLASGNSDSYIYGFCDNRIMYYCIKQGKKPDKIISGIEKILGLNPSEMNIERKKIFEILARIYL